MKGIVDNKKGKYIAQYWNRERSDNVYIGTFDTAEEAVQARALHLAKVYDGEIDDSLPKERKYPKGIDERCGKYRALVHIYHGTKNKQTTTFHIGTFNSVDEAVEARKEFILKLL